MRSFLSAAFAGLLMLVASNLAHADEEKVLNVYNWAEYIGENTVRQFERETGITSATTTSIPTKCCSPR